MSLYPMRTRTKTWPVRVMSHFASFALCNSWLEYIRDANEEGLLRKTMDITPFQTHLANCLLIYKLQKKRGRSSNENPQVMKRKAPNASPLQVSTFRYDGSNHWPQQMNTPNAQRCRREECSSKSHDRCRSAAFFFVWHLRMTVATYFILNRLFSVTLCQIGNRCCTLLDASLTSTAVHSKVHVLLWLTLWPQVP